MRCAFAESHLDALLSGELGEEAALALWSHLRGCRVCRQLLAEMILVRALGKTAQSQWSEKLAYRTKSRLGRV